MESYEVAESLEGSYFFMVVPHSSVLVQRPTVQCW